MFDLWSSKASIWVFSAYQKLALGEYSAQCQGQTLCVTGGQEPQDISTRLMPKYIALHIDKEPFDTPG